MPLPHSSEDTVVNTSINRETPQPEVEKLTEETVKPVPEVVDTKSDDVSDQVKDAVATEKTAAPVEPPYIPNKKYKVNGVEKEIEPWIESVLTKDTEPKVRELFEKAAGLDVIKPKLAAERERAQQHEQVARSLQGQFDHATKLRDMDLGLFFDFVKLPKQKVAEWLLGEMEIEGLPEPAKRAYHESKELKRRNLELEYENQHTTTTHTDSVVQARATQLEQALSTPQVESIVSQYDNRLGRAGAFQEMVIRHGAAEFQQSGGKRDLSAAEAVSECLNILGLTPVASQATQPTVPAPNPVVTTAKVVTAPKPTVIPNVGSTTASPTSRKPKNLTELRKMAEEVIGS